LILLFLRGRLRRAGDSKKKAGKVNARKDFARKNRGTFFAKESIDVMPESFDSSWPSEQVEVRLDGLPVELPSERRSFGAIRSYLELLALQQQRILCLLFVDGESVNLTQPLAASKPFARVEGETMSLQEVPAQLIKAALQQAVLAREQVQSAVTTVLINDTQRGRELWWSLSSALKEPLLTLSLLPETICGPEPATGCASVMQLRLWQLQQLSCVIRDVDAVCRFGDTTALSNALETRVLPWLDKLHEFLGLWHDTISSDSRPACQGT
jgi:hypothetical protein